MQIKFEKWSSIPIEVTIVDTLLNPEASVDIYLKNRSMDYVHLDINQRNLDVFMLPGSVDTLTFLDNDSIVFSGDLSPINLFLFQNAKKKLSFNHLNQITAMATHGEKDYVRLNEVNDSVLNIRLNNLELNKSQLPDWYVKLEKERLQYRSVATKLNSISYRKEMLQMEDSIPDDFLADLVKSVPLENEKFIGESSYMQFLHEYANLKNREKNKTKEKVDSSDEPTSIYMAREIDELFTGNIKDAFLAYRTSMIIKHVRSEYDSAVLDYFSDDQMRNFIKEYYFSSVALKPGSGMPYFFLINEKGEDVESKDYLGNVVLVNFWADWCKPCIEEFPYENALVEKYHGKPVKIVNICLETKPERWKEYITKYGLEMDNLYADEVWTKNLKIKYDIKGIPHSVLIDWNGNIVENRSKTASKGADELIDKLLEEMEL
ncbi:TlpA family protein disulfide reductase [Algoriphagus sp. AGSA1]|uniref:TlpA family protein disulfide reductase n=1 Tax=Algoriphagus sp. AGSA1 TaxID=2907213 RepID=UPI001F2C3EB7|nr:TlpA disulfide reductase family protein [Algoriphagus sp. AGSA1]MCE7057120.1 TlpA family protein disulfide reductase [Algoriphagus sp. AGSA1]